MVRVPGERKRVKQAVFVRHALLQMQLHTSSQKDQAAGWPAANICTGDYNLEKAANRSIR